MFVTESVGQRKDGSIVQRRMAGLAIRDDLGRLSHYVLVHRDITERKRAAAELAHTNEKLLQYSHELQDAKYRAEMATRAKSDSWLA